MSTPTRYEKFLPDDIPQSQIQFWNSLKAKALEIQRCDECGTYLYIPKEMCNRCYSTSLTWTQVTGEGHLYTYSVIRRAPTPAYQADAPYVLAQGLMAEGFRMTARLRGVEPEDVCIGMPIRVSYEDITYEWTLPVFEPTTGDSG